MLLIIVGIYIYIVERRQQRINRGGYLLDTPMIGTRYADGWPQNTQDKRSSTNRSAVALQIFNLLSAHSLAHRLALPIDSGLHVLEVALTNTLVIESLRLRADGCVSQAITGLPCQQRRGFVPYLSNLGYRKTLPDIFIEPLQRATCCG